MQVEFETLKGKRFNAKVKEFIDASPDGSGIPVTAVIDDETFAAYKGLVSTGFSCSVIITTPGPTGNEAAIAIPVNAVFGDVNSGSRSVWVYNASTKASPERRLN